MLSATTQSSAALLDGLLDYAGLFPPARREMKEALEGYRAAQASAHSGLLGSFVLPLARIDEFVEAAEPDNLGAGRTAGTGGDTLPLSLIVPHDQASQVRAVRQRLEGVAAIGALEIPPAGNEEIRGFSAQVPDDIQIFHEVPVVLARPEALELQESTLRALDAVALAGACAKIRTGGLDGLAFPSIFALAAFVEACRERGVPFKATAGLHHAVRGAHRTEGSRGILLWMHGFLNLSIGAALSWAGKVTAAELVEVLSESSVTAFELRRKELRWRERVLLPDEIRRCRRGFFQSFGSCSFSEPAEELEAAEWVSVERLREVRV